jgi:hypothetical protein
MLAPQAYAPQLHRVCKNHETGFLSTNSTQVMNRNPINQLSKVHFLVRPGSHFSRPGRAVFDRKVRKDESMLAASSAATRRAWH